MYLPAAEGDFLCNTARKAVLDTHRYKAMSYQLANAYRLADNGFLFTHLDRNGEEFHCKYLAVYASADGSCMAIPDWQLVNTWSSSPDLRLIRYDNVIHLYNADNSAIVGLRTACPKDWQPAARTVTGGDGRYFSGTMFYHPALSEYCYEKLLPMSGDLLAQLIASPAFKEYQASHPDSVPERAWITDGGYIVTDYYGEYHRDGNSFTMVSGKGGGRWIARRTNGQYFCFG